MIELLLNKNIIIEPLSTNYDNPILTHDSIEIDVDTLEYIDTNYNGLMLQPISCVLTQELNGVWQLELVNALDEYFEYINENEILRVDTPNFEKQLFRIAHVEKTNKLVKAIAYPIFLDSADEVFLFDNRPTDCNGQQALDWMTAGTKYSGTSDIININTAYYENKNLMEAIAGDIEQSFLNRWGGEILYDNYRIIINRSIGSDNYIRVETGFNLTGIEETIEMNSVVTRYIPKAFNGYMLAEGYIDSPLIDKYPKVYSRIIDCSKFKLQEDCEQGEQGFANLDTLREAMKLYCQALMDDGMDKPTITYEINMVDLSHTDEYKDYSDLTRITLGDVVHCKHKRLNITTDARVIKIVYDCVYKEIQEITLGSFKNDYFKSSSRQLAEALKKTLDSSYLEQWLESISNKETRTLIAEKINGTVDLFKTQLRAQKDIEHTSDVRAILFEDLDESSDTYGAMSIGTQGFQIANTKVETTGEWNWSTLGTANGFYATNIFGNEITGLKINSGILNSGEIYYGNEPAYSHVYGTKTSDKEYIYHDTFGGGGEHHRLYDRGFFDASVYKGTTGEESTSQHSTLRVGYGASYLTNASDNTYPSTTISQSTSGITIDRTLNSDLKKHYELSMGLLQNNLSRYSSNGVIETSLKQTDNVVGFGTSIQGSELLTYNATGSSVAHSVRVYDGGVYIDNVLVDFATKEVAVTTVSSVFTNMNKAYVNNNVCMWTTSLSFMTETSTDMSIGSVPVEYAPPSTVYANAYSTTSNVHVRVELGTDGYIKTRPYGGTLGVGSSIYFTLVWCVKTDRKG